MFCVVVAQTDVILHMPGRIASATRNCLCTASRGGRLCSQLWCDCNIFDIYDDIELAVGHMLAKLPDGMHLSLHIRLNSDLSIHSRRILHISPRYFRHGGSAGLFARRVCVCIFRVRVSESVRGSKHNTSRARDSHRPSEIANTMLL